MSTDGDDARTTEAWLETILQSHHKEEGRHIAVNDFSIGPGCSESENTLSDVLAIEVHYTIGEEEDGRHLSLIAKLLPQNPYSRFFVTESKFDLREIRFYTSIVPDLRRMVSVPTAECYHAKYEENEESILVLENLKKQGYFTVDFGDGLCQEQLEASISSLAEVQAASLAMQKCEGTTLQDKYPFLMTKDQAVYSYMNLVDRGYPQLMKFLVKKTEYSQIAEKLDHLKQQARDTLGDLLTPKPSNGVLAHTDFWSGNILFQETGGQVKCKIIDWQMTMNGRASNDVALLLLSSAKPDLRRNITTHLLQTYWNTFTETLQKLKYPLESEYTFTEFEQDYRDSLKVALLLCIGSIDLALGEANKEAHVLDILKDMENLHVI